MENASISSFRVYTSDDLRRLPPSTLKSAPAPSLGLGWSALGFLLAVAIGIGGSSYAAMRVAKPDLPRTAATTSAAAAGSTTTTSEQPAELTVPPAIPTPEATTSAVASSPTPASAPPKEAKHRPRKRVAHPARSADPQKNVAPSPAVEMPRPIGLPRATEPPDAPPNPYDLSSVDRGVTP